jgi:hypothetical protein
MIAADLLRAGTVASIPLTALSGHLALFQLYAVAAVLSVLGMAFDVSFRAYVPVLLQGRYLVGANSVLQGTSAVTEASGWATAGVLVQLFTAPMAIAVDAVSFLVSALSLASLRSATDPRTMSNHAEEERTPGGVLEGAREVGRNPVLRALTFSAIVSEATGQAIGVVIMLFYVRELHIAPALLGPIFGVGGIAAFAGSLICGRVIRRFGIGRALIGSMYVKGVGLLAVAAAGGPMPLIVALSVLAQLTDVGWSIHDIAVTTLLQETAPAGLSGRVFATYETARSASMLVGLALGAALGAAFGFRTVLIMAFGVGLLIPLLLILSPVRDMTVPLERAA